jgi:hypothetical protein
MKFNNSKYLKLIYLLFFIQFTQGIISKEVKININNKNINKIYKIFEIKDFSKIKDYKTQFNNGINYQYSNCGSEFPPLPGNFPCSFLSDDFFSNETPAMGSSLGGTVFIKKGINQSPFGGSVIEVSSEEDDEFKLRLFYSKDKFIKSYIFNDYLVLFRWTGKENKSLTEIFILIIKKEEVTSIRRIRFDEE